MDEKCAKNISDWLKTNNVLKHLIVTSLGKLWEYHDVQTQNSYVPRNKRKANLAEDWIDGEGMYVNAEIIGYSM